MRCLLAILFTMIWTYAALAACSEQEIYAKHAQFAMHFNQTYLDQASSAAAIKRLQTLMRDYEQKLPSNRKGSLRAACEEIDMMNRAIGR